ncbi:MAG: hypothetical protein J5791_06020 [Fibrobacter sp.]|nr:hypothetical protein [Fibrobacter sp.]
MKKISLFAIASSAALMTACTDYVSKIEELQQEHQSGAQKLYYASGCTCDAFYGNLIQDDKLYYNTASGNPTVSFALKDCFETPSSISRMPSSYDDWFIDYVNIRNTGAWWIDMNLNSTAQNALMEGSVYTAVEVYNAEGAADQVACPTVSFGYKNDVSSTSQSSSASFGTCAPSKTSVLQGEMVTWSFSYSSSFSSVTILSATIDWSMPGGSTSNSTSPYYALTSYNAAGTYNATATVMFNGEIQEIPCGSVNVNAVSSGPTSSTSVSENAACGDLWCGLTDIGGKVETGSNEESAGYWYDFTDYNDGGTSHFVYPADVEANEYDNFFGPLIEAYHGIKGTVTLGAGYDYPYAGLAFDVVSESQEGGNISGWDGICLVYKSTLGFSLELGVEDEANVTGYNNYKASLPKETSMAVHDVGWDKFKQESGWGETVDRDYVLEHVSTIKLKFKATAGTTGDFLIQSIGRYGKCN